MSNTTTVITEYIQGPPGPIAANVTALATLETLPLSGVTYPAGTLVGYTPVAGGMTVYFQLAPTSVAAPDGLTTIAANGGGNWLLVRGAGGNPIQVKGVSYKLASFDLGADFSAGGLTCTMPDAPVIGWPYFVSVAGAGNLTINGNGKNINGQPTQPLAAPYQSATLVYNGTEFRMG